MTEMIDRVARAIFKRIDGGSFEAVDESVRTAYRLAAVAAIEEMREPSDKMLDVGADLLNLPEGGEKEFTSYIYQSYIDAALT